MDGMLCFIVLDPVNGAILRLTARQFKLLLHGQTALKSFAGQTVRAAIVWVPKDEYRALTDSAQAVYPFLRFKQDGRLDRQFIETARKEVRRLGELQYSMKLNSNVIDAAKIFEGKRVANLYTWSPSDEVVQEIVAVVNEQAASM